MGGRGTVGGGERSIGEKGSICNTICNTVNYERLPHPKDFHNMLGRQRHKQLQHNVMHALLKLHRKTKIIYCVYYGGGKSEKMRGGETIVRKGLINQKVEQNLKEKREFTQEERETRAIKRAVNKNSPKRILKNGETEEFAKQGDAALGGNWKWASPRQKVGGLF